MKTILRQCRVWAVIGLIAVACADFDDSAELSGGSMWSGEYGIERYDGNDHHSDVGVIQLFFVPDGKKCSVAFGYFGYKGYCVFTAEWYEVRWTRKNRFSLYSTSGGQSLPCFSGAIFGDNMKLQALNCDSVASTYELVNVSYQYD